MVSDGSIPGGQSPDSTDPPPPPATAALGVTTTASISTITAPPPDPLSGALSLLQSLLSLLQSLLSPPYNLGPTEIASLLNRLPSPSPVASSFPLSVAPSPSSSVQSVVAALSLPPFHSNFINPSPTFPSAAAVPSPPFPVAAVLSAQSPHAAPSFLAQNSSSLDSLSTCLKNLHLSPSFPVSTPHSIPSPNITNLVSIKLNSENFLLWKSQFSTVLISYDLFGYIDGTIPCPPSYVQDSSGAIIPNPSHSNWNRTDSSIKSWLIATISQDIFRDVHHLATSREIWLTLESRFLQQVAAKQLQYKMELSQIKKGELTCDQYLNKTKSLADNVAAVNHPVSAMELVMQALNGLPQEYESFVTAISMQPNFVSFSDLRAKLLSYESRLLQHQSSSSITPAFVANSSSSQPSHPSGRSNCDRGRHFLLLLCVRLCHNLHQLLMCLSLISLLVTPWLLVFVMGSVSRVSFLLLLLPLYS